MPYPVKKFHKEFLQFCLVNEAFTPEEADKIIDLEDLNRFQKGAVGSSENKVGEVRTSTRDSDIMWIHHEPNSDWLFQKFAAMVSFVNYDYFMLDISHFDAFQYSLYRSKDQQHYDWHLDTGPVYEPFVRKISVSILLSDPDEYEGGEFECVIQGQVHNPTCIKPKKGEAVFFSSSYPHRVRPVTSGVRKSLVCWILGKNNE
jgi:PKHD-type hydroxylase